MNQTLAPQIGVIGGGISGIAATHFLNQLGYQSEIIEAAPQIGGRCEGAALGERMLDIGAKGIGHNYPLFRSFLSHLNAYQLDPITIQITIAQNGGVEPMSPKKYMALVNPSLIKLGLLMNRVKDDPRNGYLDSDYFNSLADKYDHRPISAHFNPKTVARLIRPMVANLNGCEPDNYYLGNFGGNLKTAMDSFDQLRHGISEVLNDFTQNHTVLLNSRVTDLKVLGTDDGVELSIEQEGGVTQRHYDAVVITLPAQNTRQLLAHRFSRLADLLEPIHYYPVAVANVGYRQHIFSTTVGAINFPTGSVLTSAMSYGPEDFDIVRYTFSGRQFVDTVAPDTEPEKMISMGEKALSQYLNVSKRDRKEYVYRYYDPGLCAYSPYHHRRLADIRSELKQRKHITLAGDYIRGVSTEACFQASKEAVTQLHAKLSGTRPS